MSFRLLIVSTGPSGEPNKGFHYEQWPRRLAEAVPGIEVDIANTTDEAEILIENADAAFGYVLPQVFVRAKKLRWIASPHAGPLAGFYHPALIESDVVVTNTREIFNDHIGTHIMSFVLAFARGLHRYIPSQQRREWLRPAVKPVHLPEATAVIVGVGGIGSETARFCAAFGMTVVGIDARRTDVPPGVAELLPADALAEALPRGDFVIATVPETPETRGMFRTEQFSLMKESAFFINIGRRANVILDDLVAALESGTIAGAALDVFQIEPLPEDHLLWTAPGMLITPHVAGEGPYLEDRRTDLLVENCVRFSEGKLLKNVVDKKQWF